MKAVELRKKTVTELKDELNAAKKELFNLRFQKTYGNVDNSARFRQLKRFIATIHTVVSEKKIGESNA